MQSNDRLAYAQETHRMALEMERYIFPPWRWRKWWRQYREVRRRLDYLRSVDADGR